MTFFQTLKQALHRSHSWRARSTISVRGLPDGCIHPTAPAVIAYRIRHYGLLANGNRAANVARARDLLGVLAPTPQAEPKGTDEAPQAHARACPCCGSPMYVIEVFARGETPRNRPTPIVIRIDTS